MDKGVYILLFTVAVAAVVVDVGDAVDESNPDYWLKQGSDEIKAFWQNVAPNYKLADNVILMVGDGLGVSTVTAARIYKGQKMNKTGEEYKLFFETLPNVGLSKTYNIDRQVADSAGTAVAMMTGVKTNLGTLGLSGEVPYGDNCTEFRPDRKLKTVLDYALDKGKSVGIVTTTRITHATPAATYAHSPNRDWEKDTNMEGVTGCEGVHDIAYQLIMDNPQIQVILGGGRRNFYNRLDNKNLTKVWEMEKANRNVSYKYVGTKEQFDKVDPANTDYLLGLFAESHMEYEGYRDKNLEPSLSEMVEKAIKILSKNREGFFLLVEGGRIDHAHHENHGRLALEETCAFDDAVKQVSTMTSSEDTLTVVTADHSHVFTISGYSVRGKNILDRADSLKPDEAPLEDEAYLTLGYANGPAGKKTITVDEDTTGYDFTQQGCVKMNYETHGGEDVPIYAQGPMAHLIHTTHEQSFIGHVLLYASCLGHYRLDKCDMPKRHAAMSSNSNKDGNTAVRPLPTLSVSVAVVLILALARRLL